jgi:hypothetical protein
MLSTYNTLADIYTTVLLHHSGKSAAYREQSVTNFEFLSGA